MNLGFEESIYKKFVSANTQIYSESRVYIFQISDMFRPRTGNSQGHNNYKTTY